MFGTLVYPDIISVKFEGQGHRRKTKAQQLLKCPTVAEKQI